MKTDKASSVSAVCAAVALIASRGAGPLRAQAAEGFVPLFNGRDLTGWVPLQVAPAATCNGLTPYRSHSYDWIARGPAMCPIGW